MKKREPHITVNVTVPRRLVDAYLQAGIVPLDLVRALARELERWSKQPRLKLEESE